MPRVHVRVICMSKDATPQDLIGYGAMHEAALRGVVRMALDRARTSGSLPGDHHFYISFQTLFPGVAGPDDLLGRYPEEMTIVLQHQYWDLIVDDEKFSVTLQFGGQPKRLTVPYLGMTRFYDPSVQYLLQFTPPVTDVPVPKPKARLESVESSDTSPSGPKIVSLDQFRKK